MSALQSAVTVVCIVCVVAATVRLLLPDNAIGSCMKTVLNLLIAAAVVQSFLSAIGVVSEWPELSYQTDSEQAEQYLTDRMVETLTEEAERIIRETLQQFGIKNGQISIDFSKEKYGSVQLEHISVYIPKEYAGYQQSVKKLLLERFDVFCDVSVAEEEA